MDNKSILQPWVTKLGLRYQGTLLTAIRGCDGRPKEAPEKALLRELRGLMLVPFDARELDFDRGFMTRFPSEGATMSFQAFLQDLDGLPVHFVMHLAHAMEIIGYEHPEQEVRGTYHYRYLKLVKRLHLRPEHQDDLRARLTEDRIGRGTVEA